MPKESPVVPGGVTGARTGAAMGNSQKGYTSLTVPPQHPNPCPQQAEDSG